MRTSVVHTQQFCAVDFCQLSTPHYCFEMDKTMNNLVRKAAAAAIALALTLGVYSPASAQAGFSAITQVQQATSRTVTVDGVVLNHQEARMIRLVNQHRASHGITPVKVSQVLTNQSRHWSKVQSGQDRMAHGPDNCYENVAWNNYDASSDAFFKQWKASPGHNRNMLERHATKIGYGITKNISTGRYYATMQLL